MSTQVMQKFLCVFIFFFFALKVKLQALKYKFYTDYSKLE